MVGAAFFMVAILGAVVTALLFLAIFGAIVRVAFRAANEQFERRQAQGGRDPADGEG